MKKTTYTKKKKNEEKDLKKKKNLEKLEKEKLELTDIYKYQGVDKAKAKIRNNAKTAKYEADKLKLKYKKGGLGQKILIILMLFLIFCMTIGVLFTLYIIINSPKFDTSNLYSKESSVLLDKNGNEYARLGTENRELVTYDELPQVLIDAIVATEDSRFYQHNGVDMARFTKAVLGQLLGHSDAGGGSTLTMQVVKNTYTSTESNGISGIIRKFTDIYMSVFKVEKAYTKDQIIEFYVNIPYLGSGAYGVEQASQIYFGKNISELSLSEAAMIAGLFQAPGSYDPYTFPEKAESRRNTVLNLMYRHGYISEAEKDFAKSISVKSMLVGNTKTLSKYQGFVDTVVEEVKTRTGNDPYTTSMTIYTTLDPEKQDVIEGIYSGETYTWKNNVAQAAMTVIDVKDGSIAAIGAGRNKVTARSYNYATMINRHPGSTAKPLFDYGPALEYLNWSTGQTLVDDTYEYTNGGSIKNWDNGFKGIVTAKYALAQSRNIPALETFQQLEQDQIKEFVTNLGITPEYDNDFINESHSIGGFNGVNPLQMAAAYSAFARGGTYIEPYSFTKVEYANSDETFTVKPKKTKAMSDSTAYMMNMMLKYAVTSGAVSAGTVSGTDVASKTGTSTVDSAIKKAKGITDNIIGDSWQLVYSPDYTISLWYGYDEITKEYHLTNNEGSGARRAISKVLGSKILKANSTWTKPASVVEATIELESDPLELAGPSTPSDLVATELFKKGATPTDTSTRFATLENPTGLNYTSTDSSVTITWKGIATPKSIDTNYLTEYYSKNIYNHWGDKYLNRRIEYNNNVLGGLGYAIYMNGSLIGTTTQTNYTYNGTITENTEVIVKSTYMNYSSCESSGASINISPNGTTSPSTDTNKQTTTTKTTQPADTSFTIGTKSGNSSINKADAETIVSGNGASIISVILNGKDVANEATISGICYNTSNNETECNSVEVSNISVVVKYNGIPKNKTISIID